LNYLDFFGYKAFVWFIIIGSVLGFSIGLSLVIFLGRRGFFKRSNKLYNIVIKGVYAYIPVVFTITFLFVSLIVGLQFETKKVFDVHRDALTKVTVTAVQRAFSELHEATDGRDILGEFIPNIADVMATYVDDAAFQVLITDDVLMEFVGPVRYGLKVSLKSAVEGEINTFYPRNSVITAHEFYNSFQSSVLSSFKDGYYPQFFWDELASQFTPTYIRILFNAFLFLFPVCFEMAIFVIFFRKSKQKAIVLVGGAKPAPAVPHRTREKIQTVKYHELIEKFPKYFS
jgi:hypothetical protein